MSLRMFVYYCMICGAWAGFIGWVLGYAIVSNTFTSSESFWPYVLRTSVAGMFLGVAIALALSFLDSMFNLGLQQYGKVFMRVFTALLLGLLAGFLSSCVGASLFHWLQYSIFFLFGWTIAGLFIGISICSFEGISGLFNRGDMWGAIKKLIKCTVGGFMGGIIGGSFALGLKALAGFVFANKDPDRLWSPTAIGFVIIGACIGLLVAAAQVLLKEAWIRVEAGFRPGRELILMKEKTSIGRAEGSDIALFGDMAVEKAHAMIVLDGGRYYLEDQNSPGGSYVNEQRVQGRAPLKAGDLIRVGSSVLRFNERAKRND